MSPETIETPDNQTNKSSEKILPQVLVEAEKISKGVDTQATVSVTSEQPKERNTRRLREARQSLGIEEWNRQTVPGTTESKIENHTVMISDWIEANIDLSPKDPNEETSGFVRSLVETENRYKETFRLLVERLNDRAKNKDESCVTFSEAISQFVEEVRVLGGDLHEGTIENKEREDRLKQLAKAVSQMSERFYKSIDGDNEMHNELPEIDSVGKLFKDGIETLLNKNGLEYIGINLPFIDQRFDSNSMETKTQGSRLFVSKVLSWGVYDKRSGIIIERMRVETK